MAARNRIALLPTTDFTGGLNKRADAFQLRGTESPDMLNVDLDPSGGFAQRDAVARLNTTVLSADIGTMWPFFTTAGTKQIIVQQGSDAAYSTGGNFTGINPDGLTTTGKMRAATFNGKCYVQRNAEQVPWRWDGSSATVLTSTFNDNIESPNDGDVPTARYIAAWKGYLWVAYTVESATTYSSRVRFSHPNKGEDWRTDDYIDVEIGNDGDWITGLLPFGDKLLVFKNQSVHAITGFDADSFAPDRIADVGAISQDAIAATEYGCYFFSWPDGLYFLGRDGAVAYAFERLQPLLHDGTIPASQHTKITLGWIRRRLWVNVPWDGSSVNEQTLVLDPTINTKQYGAWTRYDTHLSSMLQWEPPGAAALFLGASSDSRYVYQLHQDLDQDDLAGANVDIESHYTTRWIDNEQPAVPKRWKRPELVLDERPGLVLGVQLWKDYDATTPARQFTVTIPDADVGSSTLIWDVGQWDEEDWAESASDADVAQSIERVGMLGRARSVRLRFSGPTGPSMRWAVNAITYKFIPRRIRG